MSANSEAAPQISPPRRSAPLSDRWWFALLLLSATLNLHGAVATSKHPVENAYYGLKVKDDYQWLEDAAAPDVQRWSRAQNRQARAFLDRLWTRPWLAERLKQLATAPSTNYYSLTWRPESLFLLKFRPPAEQPVLIALSSVTNLRSERIILDPNKLDSKGTTAIDWFVPSRDGKLVAVSLSEKGSELGTLHIIDASTGQQLPDTIPGVNGPTAGGSAAWNADGSGLFYTRYPRPGERPEADLGFYQQVYFHRLGAAAADERYETGRDFPRIAEIELAASPDGRRVLAAVANGDGGEFAHYLREPSGEWRQLTRFQDKIVRAEFGHDPLYIEAGKDDALYLLSRDQAPNGKILRLPLASPALSNATVILAEGTNVISDFKPAASGLGVVLMYGGLSEFHFLDYTTKRVRNPRAGGGFGGPRERPISSVHGLVVAQSDEMLFTEQTYTAPYAWWRYDPNLDDRLTPTPLAGASPADFGDVEAVREMVTSDDGTKIPLNIIRKKGTRLDGEIGRAHV